MALNYECPACARKWPFAKPFSVCKVCQVRTLTSQVGEPMSQEAAKYELKLMRFNAFYARREAARVGPSPEDLGKDEAQRLIDLDRALESM